MCVAADKILKSRGRGGVAMNKRVHADAGSAFICTLSLDRLLKNERSP